jgi:tRNA nucleotidyltransferase (CCA-adding enzyme)
VVDIKMPMPVEFALNRLHSNGYESYIVGGCVRDSIIGIQPHDWDICTSALPEQVQEIFKDLKVIPTGLQHGTVTVVFEDGDCKQCLEITTYRIDGEYKDNRHPENVKFVSDLSLDLMRRDFTINAMAYNDKEGIIDMFGGVEDIEMGCLRCVGNPDDRFQEDALRIMRAIRFAIRYDLQIDDEVIKSIQKNKILLKNVSVERICAELTKILESNIGNDGSKKNRIKLIGYLIDFLQVVLDYKIDSDEQEVYNRLAFVESNVPLRLAILFDTTDIMNILKDLRFSNDVVFAAHAIREYGHKILDDKDKWSSKSSIAAAVNNLHIGDREYNVEDDSSLRYYARRSLKNIHSCSFESIISFAKAYVNDEYMFVALNILQKQMQFCKENDVYCLQYLAVNGNDIMQAGFEGKDIGDILNKLLDMVMREDVRNNREELLAVVSKFR